MDLQNIVMTCEANNVHIDKDLQFAGAKGYPSTACRELAQHCIATIDTYCRHGMKYGFSQNVKDAIDALSGITVDLSEDKAEKNKEKLRKRIDDAKQKAEADIARDLKSSKNKTSIKEEVFKYVDSGIDACRVLMAKNPKDPRNSILQDSVDRLEELRGIIQEAMDDATEHAAKIAKKIIEHLLGWRYEIANGLHSEGRTVEHIENAITEAYNWKQLREAARSGLLKNNRAKEEDIVKFRLDAVERIVRSEGVESNIDIYMKNFDRSRKEILQRFGTDKTKEDVKSLRGKIDELNAEKNTIFEQVRNGELDKVYAMHECKLIDGEIGDYEKEIRGLQTEILQNGALSRRYERLFRKLERINRFLASYKNDPATLYTLAEVIDFGKLTAALRGMATPDVIEQIVQLDLSKRLISDKQREMLDGLQQSLDEEDREYEERLAERERRANMLSPEAEKQARKQEEAAADDYFAQMEQNKPRQKSEEQNAEDQALEDALRRLDEEGN